MGNSCGCCNPNNDSSNPNLVPPSPANSHPHPHLSAPPPSLESVILSIKQSIGNENPTHNIDLIIKFIDTTLLKIKAPSEHEASTSSSGIQLESVAWGTRAASDIIEGISREANELEKSEVAKELGRVALKAVKLVGESHWIFLGLSMAAYALERCVTVSSNVSECYELLEKIVHLAKDVKKLGETIPHDNERLLYAVHVIVEGTILCCEYSTQGKTSRYWFADVMKAQLEKTGKSIQDITSSLTLSAVADIKRQLTQPIQRSPQKLLDFKPEGIEERVAEVKEMVDLEGSEAAAALLLWGFGGVGKSVLASTVIQELDCVSKGFKFCMGIIDEKIADKTSHIIKLQKDIIYDLGGGKLDLRNTMEGRQQVQKVVRDKRCLIFIDNVVDSYYIKELLPSKFLQLEENTGSGEENTGSVQATKEARLRIVITSRENNFKRLLNIRKLYEYRVDPLPYPAARVILGTTILDESQVNGDFDEERCINAIAEACKGVPLLLSVFGNYLRVERHQTAYEEALKALKEGDIDRFDDEGNLSEKLMFVYDKMRDQEAKEAFLDICTYFHGWSWENVGDIVDSSRLEVLQKRGLVKRDESGKVIVHDILRLMGRKAAKETRITDFSEFSAVVEDEYKLKNVKGVTLIGNSCLAKIESTHLNVMRHSLRVLRLGDWVTINGLCDGDFTNLRYLYLGDVAGFPFTDASKMEKLTRFYSRSKTGMDLRELPRTLKAIQLQDPGCEELATLPLENLKKMISFTVISSKPVELPEGFKLPASLEWLRLSNCTELPETFSHLTNIEYLDLSKCDFESLPEGFGRLVSLKNLYMKYCPSLKSLSEGFGSLCALTNLSVEGCSCLENLPADFGRLTALQNLWMGKCESLRTLSEDFGGLSSLQYLDISGCISLKRLPESFSKLSIKSLNLESLISLDELPQRIGDMSSLTRLILDSCNSLTSLPNSLVKLKMLRFLKINNCIKLATLPNDFGQLSSLTYLIVNDCPVLKKLPDGFQALRLLKILELRRCRNLVNLSPGFGKLNCLEQLYIDSLPLSSLPKGFGNLKRLWKLWIWNGFKLETLSDDIENLVTLRTLGLSVCPILDGTTMEKILKLQNCSFVRIYASAKLIEWWEEMQDKEKYPMLVSTRRKYPSIKNKDWQRGARVALFSLNCKELNGSSDELTDRSSIAIDVDTTVALISLPLHLKSHHEDHLKNLCELAKKRSRTACSGQLQIIISLKGVELDKQREIEDEEEEEEMIRKALKWLPQGSCAIPVADIRRRFLVKEVFFRSYSEEGKLVCFTADVRVQDKMTFQDGETMGEDNISEKLKQNFHKSIIEEEEKATPNELQECLKLLCNSRGEESERSAQIPHPAKLNILKMLVQALKSKGIYHFIDPNMKEVHINQLEGKNVCFIMCDLNILLYTKIQQICKDLQILNFEGVWIPLSSNDNHGIGTYIRTCRYMSLAALLHPMITQGIKETNAHFILLSREGKIISRAPLSLVMSWEIKAYPFRESDIEKIVSKVNEKSPLEFLLRDMDILDHEGNKGEKQLINNKLTFLYVEPPTYKLELKSRFDQLLQVHKDFKILYLGHFSSINETNVEAYRKVYEDATQKMHWLKLSFEEMVKFWYRCSYLSGNFVEKLNLPFTLQKLVKQLCIEKRSIIFLDSGGIVTGNGKEVVDIICQSVEENGDEIDIMLKDELIKSSLESGKCSRILQTYFTTDEVHNHPQHQHLLSFILPQNHFVCDICFSTIKVVSLYDQGVYVCNDCDWGICEDCWKLYVRRKVQNMLEM